MKHILPRNLNFLGLLVLLPGFIFHFSRQFLTPQPFPGTIESVCIPGKPYPVITHFNPKSFSIIKTAGSCLTDFDIIHFPAGWLHPFFNCFVYKLMKEKIMSPVIQNYTFAVAMIPVVKEHLSISSSSNSKTYPEMIFTKVKLASIPSGGTNNDTFN